MRTVIISYSPAKLIKKGEAKSFNCEYLFLQSVYYSLGLDQIIVRTDTGLSSKTNRKFNDLSINGKRFRSFITTQSVKQLPAYLKEFSLDTEG